MASSSPSNSASSASTYAVTLSSVIDQVMKESSCHDPKMEAYCKAVRRLEDKFDGLELNHVPRKYNEGEAGGTPWPCACAGLALAGWRRQNALASDGCGMRRPAAAPQRHYSISVS